MKELGMTPFSSKYQLLAFEKLKRLSGCMLEVDKPVATGEIKKLQAKLR